MAFFPRTIYNTSSNDTSFHPLFRLLDDFDSYSRQSSRGKSCRRSAIAHFQPKFDVRETGEAYELHGELPGLNKENVHIEFTEPQTIVVRGRVERTYTAGTPPTGAVESTPEPAAAITETPAEETPEKDTASHKATVEDDDEADTDSHDGFEEIVTEKPEAPAPVEEPKAEEPKKQADKAKYWLTERSVGEFSRSFNFPTRVDQDAVSASFNDGILSVVVPKAKKHETRRIAVY